MKKNIIKFLKKQWLLVWVIVVSASLLTFAVYAEYSESSVSMKRVVVSKSNGGPMFSSNVLVKKPSDDNIAYKPKYVSKLSDSTKKYVIGVYLWNYDQKDFSNVYYDDITYSVSIRLCNTGGTSITLDSGKSVEVYDSTGSPETLLGTLDSTTNSISTFTRTLTRGTGSVKSNEHYYVLKYSSNWDLTDDINNCVEIIATPTDTDPNKYNDINPLAARIGLQESHGDQPNAWDYYINEEKLDSTKKPNDYDGYNLILSGSGAFTITIECDPTKIKINKDFYDPNSPNSLNRFISGEVTFTAGTNGTWDKLVIKADSNDSARNYRNRYSIQLYRVDPEGANWASITDWSFIGTTNSGFVKVTIAKTVSE